MSFADFFKKKSCTDSVNNSSDDTKNSFMESIKSVENNDTKLLNLQKQYRNGEIKPKELTQEQVDALLELYDQQIFDLKISIELKKRKIAEFKDKAKA